MNACNTTTPQRMAACPVNGIFYKQVTIRTILHNIKQPWTRNLPEQAYYYCDDPCCDVVYFGEDKQIITSDEMRLDNTTRENTVCFCFDVSKDNLKSDKKACKAFVTQQTRQSACDCVIRNPSGRCCLKEFK